jgi:hypothetical protein
MFMLKINTDESKNKQGSSQMSELAPTTQPEAPTTAEDEAQAPLDRLNDRSTFTTFEEAPAVETKPEQNTKTLEDILEGLHDTVAGALASQEQQLNELKLENESLKDTVAQLTKLNPSST